MITKIIQDNLSKFPEEKILNMFIDRRTAEIRQLILSLGDFSFYSVKGLWNPLANKLVMEDIATISEHRLLAEKFQINREYWWGFNIDISDGYIEIEPMSSYCGGGIPLKLKTQFKLMIDCLLAGAELPFAVNDKLWLFIKIGGK
jgi:hypothetical protein